MTEVSFLIRKPFDGGINFASLTSNGKLTLTGWLSLSDVTPVAVQMGVGSHELVQPEKSAVSNTKMVLDGEIDVCFIYFYFIFENIDPDLRELDLAVVLQTKEQGLQQTSARLILPPNRWYGNRWYEPSYEIYPVAEGHDSCKPDELGIAPNGNEKIRQEQFEFRAVDEPERSIVIVMPRAEGEQLALLRQLVQSTLSREQLIFIFSDIDNGVNSIQSTIKGAEVVSFRPFAGHSQYLSLNQRIKGRYLIFIQNFFVDLDSPIDSAIALLKKQASLSYVNVTVQKSSKQVGYEVVSINDSPEYFVYSQFPHHVVGAVLDALEGRCGNLDCDFIVSERAFFNENSLAMSIRDRKSVKQIIAGEVESTPAIQERLRLILKKTRLRKLDGVGSAASRSKRKVSFYTPEQVNEATVPSKSKIALVTLEFEGPFRNGGIGTAYTGLARALALAGHEVTVLYCGPNLSDVPVEDWIKHYAASGIRLEFLPPARHPLPDLDGRWKSYHVYEWLKGREFEIVHFHELAGLGYYSMVAKKQGLGFQRTSFIVGLHSPITWVREASNAFSQWQAELENDFMEEQSVKLADVVISPSAYMFDWIQDHHWELPKHAWVLPNICPEIELESVAGQAFSTLKEIVFFGRLESRKGVELFCDALDLLNQQPLPPFRVVFMGKVADLGPNCPTDDYISARAARWSFPVELLTEFNNKQALQYLKSGNRIAVMPSLTENSPYTVLECLKHQIPFVASRVGGIPELVAKGESQTHLFEPNKKDLADKLLRALVSDTGPCQPAVDFEQVERCWLGLHQYCLTESWVDQEEKSEEIFEPLVSVCMAHKDRPELLKQAIDSLKQQTYTNFELIIVDDESTKPETIEYLQKLSKTTFPFDCRLIRQPWSYLGAARNMAALHACGEYLLFMDDDNVAKPEEIETLVQIAARQPDIDIFTPANDRFRGSEYPDDSFVPIGFYLPLGNSMACGLLQNSYGDANFLIKRQSFLSIGGFWESINVGYEDWQFLAHAAISGLRQQPVPEALYWYRVGGGGMLLTAHAYNSLITVFQPYWERVKGGFRQLLPYLYALNLKNHGRAAEVSGRNQSEDALFELGQPLLSLNPNNRFSGIQAHYQIYLQNLDSGLVCEAIGDDPILLLPEFPIPESGSLIISISIVGSFDTVCELFYLKDANEDYSWKHCLGLKIAKGLNKIMFKIDDLPIIGRLRLDPGYKKGVYQIRSIEVRHAF